MPGALRMLIIHHSDFIISALCLCVSVVQIRGVPMTRDEALVFVQSMVQNENLVRHMLAVEAAVRAYASEYGGGPDVWALAGLLHDADWEAYPDEHPKVALDALKERGDVPDEVLHAIAAHAPERTGVEPLTDLDKVLFACDELAGFISACALVRPQRLEGLTPKSVEKRLKSPAFAAGVNRTDVNRGIELLGVDRAVHISRVIDAMQTIAPELGLKAATG
jgi:predicted hydrolase (HD superfamily)